MDDEIVTVAEAANRLGWPRSTLYRWAKQRRLPGLIVLNGCYRVRMGELLAAVERGPAAAEPGSSTGSNVL